MIRTWSVSPSGDVALIDSIMATWGSQPMLVDEVDLSVVGNDRREFVVATSREAITDELRVQSFSVSSTGQLAYLSGYGGGVVDEVSSVAAGKADVLVGVESSTGTTIGTSFAVHLNTGGSGGGRVRRVGKREAGAIRDIDVGARGGNKQDVVLAVVDGNDDIRLIHYSTNYAARQ